MSKFKLTREKDESSPWGVIRVSDKRKITVEAESDIRAEQLCNLISAAPELLEALEDLFNTERHCDDGEPKLEAARDKARYAIAKARGEA